MLKCFSSKRGEDREAEAIDFLADLAAKSKTNLPGIQYPISDENVE